MTLTTTPTKQCTKCGRTLTVDWFAAHPQTRDGLQSWCRGCKTIGMRLKRARDEQ